MSRGTKILIGILSVLPVLLTGVLISAMLIGFSNSWGRPDANEPTIFENFRLFFLLIGGLFVLSTVMLFYFIVHVARNKKMDSTERVIWILVFILGGAIGYPIYWYMKIWKDEP